MSAIRKCLALLALAGLSLLAADGGPLLGKWEFAGKDNLGFVWKGTLKIEKLDPTRFEAQKYHSLCSLEMESNDPALGTKGVEHPCVWNAGTREIVFGDAWPQVYVFRATVSADGKTLVQGKWQERNLKRGQLGPVIRSGEWTAKLADR